MDLRVEAEAGASRASRTSRVADAPRPPVGPPGAARPSPLRMQMYDYIQRNPAAHILEIAERFGLTHPTVMYHLSLLEDEGYVLSTLWGKRRVHFDTQGHFNLWEREILAILALDEARSILEHVGTHPGTFPRQIARELGVSETTVKRYVPELLRLYVLQEEQGSFRRRLWLSAGFRKRGKNLLAKLPVDARPAHHLEALLATEE
jgi:DNA-binding MarR family transcriptional regulator